MIYVIYFFGVFFILLSIPMLYVFYREKHFGIFLMGIIYSFSGLMAISLPHWWPLLVGFVMAWLLRLMGLEPTIEPKAEGGNQKTEGGSQKNEAPKA